MSDNFNAISIFLYKIIFAFSEGFNAVEFSLNILFIALIIIFCMIIYWDTINRHVAKTSRCKRQMDIYNKNKGVYVINASDKDKKPLYQITYDVNQNNLDVKCNCKEGKFVNYFNNIPVKDTKTNKDVKVDKMCSCDKYYNVGMLNQNVVYDGEPGILRYMTTKNSDFFDNLLFTDYSIYPEGSSA